MLLNYKTVLCFCWLKIFGLLFLSFVIGKRCRSYQQLQRDTSADIPASSSSHDVYFHPAATYSVSPKK